MPVKVGIVDSGVAPVLGAAVAASVGLTTRAPGGPVLPTQLIHAAAHVERVAAIDDPVGHGTAVAMLVLAAAPMAHIASAQAFARSRHADAACVAEAIGWCVEQQARVVNLSLGLSCDHPVLRKACAAALACGTILIASFPARGANMRPAIYPALYPGVLAVCGDARCDDAAWSMIEPDCLYGASTLSADGRMRGGASYAAARMSGLAARFLEAQPDAGAKDFRQWLAAGAAFHGRERHQPGRAA